MFEVTPGAAWLAREMPLLLRGEVEAIAGWAARPEVGRLLRYLTIIILGSGVYGAAMGWWRSPVQAGYNVLKFPLVLVAVAVGNGLINGMLAPLLGLNLRFREAFTLVLMSFAIAALILAAFAPLTCFLVLNVPPMRLEPPVSFEVYCVVQLAQVGVIALAGLAANLRLYQTLRHLCGRGVVAARVVLAWLAVNLLLGGQLCWILRPFIGSPGLPVEFLRPNAFEGNIYETVFRTLLHLLTQ